MKKGTLGLRALIVLAVAFAPWGAWAQVNSGSNGSDGAFTPATSTIVNMADHPNGIYQYSSVVISNGVTVTFIPNAANTPVVWLVQSNCVINGAVNVAGQSAIIGAGGTGGPGGYRGGNPGVSGTPGQGPGGGGAADHGGGSASYGTVGSTNICSDASVGSTYGNDFLIPLLGGSGGGGERDSGTYFGGGGGGGAILIACSGTLRIAGTINISGGNGMSYGMYVGGGGGSGGAVRLVAASISGGGSINAAGGYGGCYTASSVQGGSGRVRFDTLDNGFGGYVTGVFTTGFQPIIFPAAGQGAQVTIATVAGAAVSASPTGVLSTPDSTISGQQANPIAVVVNCANVPLNSPITVSVKPASGAVVTAVGQNNSGTQASSTATVLINIPRGGGIIWATATTGS